jgi:hypothetical protein
MTSDAAGSQRYVDMGQFMAHGSHHRSDTSTPTRPASGVPSPHGTPSRANIPLLTGRQVLALLV